MNNAYSNRWLTMLAGYASHHQHPTNVMTHIIGVPCIMLGMFVPMSALQFSLGGFQISLADITFVGLALFYLRLDVFCALAFSVYGFVVLMLAKQVLALSMPISGIISAVCFFGGYSLQFWGHAIEGRPPSLIKHPIQANISAPLFIVVEIFKFFGVRKNMFEAVQEKVKELTAASESTHKG